MGEDNHQWEFYIESEDGSLTPIMTEIPEIHDYPEKDSTEPECVEVTTLSDHPREFLQDRDCGFSVTVKMSRRDRIQFDFLTQGRELALFRYQIYFSNNWLRKHGLPMRKGRRNKIRKLLTCEDICAIISHCIIIH